MRGLLMREEQRTPPFVIFDVLQFLALFFVTLTLLPAVFSKSVTRMKTWFSLVISCIVYCVSFLLLVGNQSGLAPSFGLCIFQANMIYASPAALAVAALTFVIELHLRLYSALARANLNERRIVWLVAIPPVIHLAVFLVSTITGVNNRSAVLRDSSGFYCHIDLSTPTLTTGVTTGLSLVVMICIEVYTIIYLYRKRAGFRNVNKQGPALFPISLFVRASLFSIIGVCIVIADIALNATSAPSADVLNVYAIIPMFVAIVFGSQTDILSFYMFWKKYRVQVVKVESVPRHSETRKPQDISVGFDDDLEGDKRDWEARVA